MKFNIEKIELLKALLEASKIIPIRTTLPILSCAQIETEQNKIKIKTTDLEQTIIVECNAKIIEKGKTAVPINRLIELVTALKNGPFDVVSMEETDELEINSLNGNYKLTSRDPEEFPELPETTTNKKITITGKNLLNIIQNTGYAVSKDDLKPALCGIYLNILKNNITAVSTDGHRLIKYLLKTEKEENEISSLIIPIKFLNILKSVINKEDKITIGTGDNHIEIKYKNIYLLSRIIKESFPDFNSVIPENNPICAKISTEEVVDSIKRVAIFSNKTTKQVQIHFCNNEIIVSAEDKETKSSAKEHIECDHGGEEIIVKYNAQYLKEILQNLKSQETNIFLSSPQTAAVFKPCSQEMNEEKVALLMPLRSN